MNPVLLKPGSDRRSHVVVMGRPSGPSRRPSSPADGRRSRDAAFARVRRPARRATTSWSCEGAGSPAEINLRAGDYVNMGLAQHGRIPTVLVGTSTAEVCSRRCYGTRRAARRRRPGPGRRLRGQQVPRRRCPAAARAGHAGAADRPPGARRAARGMPDLLAGLRGLPRPSTGLAARPPAATTGCGSWSCGCPGSPTSPMSTRSASSPASTSCSPTAPRALAGRRRRRAAGHPRHHRRPRLAAAARAGRRGRRATRGRAARSSASAAASRCSGRRSATRRRRGRRRGGGRRARAARRAHRRSRADKVLRLPAGSALGCAGVAATRSTTDG